MIIRPARFIQQWQLVVDETTKQLLDFIEPPDALKQETSCGVKEIAIFAHADLAEFQGSLSFLPAAVTRTLAL